MVPYKPYISDCHMYLVGFLPWNGRPFCGWCSNECKILCHRPANQI